ncbi:tetratricopeptide repeat protein [Variovorax sp. M-6]|uniref:tetratricopeptide repeat protein n=1 Tax=Variovorax sp. M-6 TaxID=3233041 RepID=UPI003F9D5245
MSSASDLFQKFTAAANAAVEIRQPDSTLVCRTTLSAISDVASRLDAGDYFATVNLPQGNRLTRHVSVSSQGFEPQGIFDHVRSSFDSLPNRETSFSTFSSRLTPLAAKSSIAGLESMGRTGNAVNKPPLYGRVFTREGQSFELNKEHFRTKNSSEIEIWNAETEVIVFQVLRIGWPALNILLPSGVKVLLAAPSGQNGLDFQVRFDVELVDSLLELRSEGSLAAIVTVAKAIKSDSILELANQNLTAAVSLCYMVVRWGEMQEAQEAVDTLGKLHPSKPDLWVLRGEVAARAGFHAKALECFLHCRSIGLPAATLGLTSLVDRLRFYAASFADAQEIAFDTEMQRATVRTLEGVQPFASRCNFEMILTNYPGLDVNSPNAKDRVSESTLDSADGSVRLT